ncbi:MBL fold metallo-hydrolase [Fibrella sp. HMF5335]|uniref:MBL fold metallo-hydrolase n=1 Tax=Fibrella rubiginis TaxID=2817060 RepID=A0A939K6M9_9BACT|nr:MBL fold metallo-hydrolase [Fibrella rubiginis]MBO0937720.1 MBL fold metallo-hydrolase [Fibrella rubiginis]
MIKPIQQDDILLADIKAARKESDKLHVWWLGQSGFLLHYNGTYLLFDPYLSNSLSIKYANTDKPHTRVSARVIDPACLTMINVVTSSHNHTDHLDADTLLPLFEASPEAHFVIPEANRAFVADRLTCNPDWPIGLSAGQAVNVGAVTLHGVPAAHNELAVNEKGQNLYMGFVAEIGPYAIYHSGDTLWYDSIVETLAPFQVDLAFLPINGNKPERRVAGNLDPDEAALLGRRIGAKLVIPHHYDLFAFNTANPADFVDACTRENTPHRVMQLGEKIVMSAKQ